MIVHTISEWRLDSNLNMVTISGHLTYCVDINSGIMVWVNFNAQALTKANYAHLVDLSDL